MTSHSNTQSGKGPSNHFLELLPATTYDMPKPQLIKDPANCCSHIKDKMPTAADIEAATARRRSSSASTISSAATSIGGERRQYLQLVPDLGEL